MLSSIGRAAVRRVAARGPQSTNQALQSSRLRRVEITQGNVSTQSRSPLNLQRSYATATKVVAKPNPKTIAKAKSKAQTVPKKAVKKAVKKPVKKKVAKKPAVKKSAKKVLTDAQKEKLKVAKARKQLRELKKTALSIPTAKPHTAWLIFFSQELKKDPGSGSAKCLEISTRYNNLSPSELEPLNRIAVQNQAYNDAQYKQWVASHTTDEIRLANNARASLKSLTGKKWPHIEDPRLPKRPALPWSLFIAERWASGDLKGIRVKDCLPSLRKEWNALDPKKRQAYEDTFAANKEQYLKDYKKAFGRDAPIVLKAQKNEN
ncbi:HMG box protein [Drepanopeziza brunnea f. sp. 'multigermtubi' MB_m1]|uniref:HMG box protein n=1 Tax=Marssonina brunnea f. sp. multigermtubi (strain MB_m1) TaxID=1072389 RepID=K1WEL7_MARBU|nr:HMG box protein [Drepanopeziza brunnea f. sp. 'multigermtubi' MB_m1]EKD15905.1 HMG box protein [Drepanopeziza brunnea f. sp. 'multigermtubi' MB_m1]